MPRDMTLFEADDEGAVEGSTVGGTRVAKLRGAPRARVSEA